MRGNWNRSYKGKKQIVPAVAGGGGFKEGSMAEKDRNQRMKEITERLEQGVKEIFTSEMYMEYLKTMSQFHSYSFNNTLLIHLQKPDATLVAGYQAWQKKFHRQVRRGEKGIQIIAPAPIREKEEVEKIDPATLEPVLKPDGTPEMEEVVYTIPRFRITTVFDVSQTEGEPLPELETPELTGNVEDYEIFMQAIRDISPVPIRFDEIESGAKGFYSSTDKEIVIQNGMSESQTMKTGIHEVTHAKLHDRDIMEELEEKKDQLTREVEAESVAYIVCQYFGLDTSEYSFPYIAGWSSDRNMKELRSSMDTIRRVSGEFIDQMVERMQEIRREAQRHQENALFEEPQDRYGIYQLREDRDGTDYRFMGMAYLQEQGITVDGADYQFVYGDELQEGDTLEVLYEKFNADHPADYMGLSLSVSDVVVLKKDGEMTAHYVDSFGYQELPEFIEQRKKAREIQVEEKQAGQIGPETKGLSVEGHFGTWHTAEVKKIAMENFYRMEHDEYGDTVAGIIVNEEGRLVAEDLEHRFDVGAMEAITEYLYEKVPEPFIKQFYVVNDAYGIKAEREYQYFDNLDEAIQAYHLLPNHLDKQLGMESRELVTSRMALLKCVNGIDQLEDIEKNFLSGKWINQEIADAQRKAEFYLDNRDTEIAYHLEKQYFFIQTGAAGYDYTTYDAGFKEIDGGILDDMDIPLKEAVMQILENHGLAWNKCEVIDCEKFLDNVADVVPGKIYPAELSSQNIRILAEELDQFQYDNDFYEYQDQVESRENHIKEIEELICDGKIDVIQGWLQNYMEENNNPEDILRTEQLLNKIQTLTRNAETDSIKKEDKITFYVAECIEFPVLGEYHDHLSLQEAYEKYQAIPSDRIHGIKGIGFLLEDGSMYDGNYELMRAGVISKDMIDLVPHYRESPLVQKAMTELEDMLAKEKHREEMGKPDRWGEQDKTEQAAQTQEAEKPTGIRQSVLAALRERQVKIKAREQMNTTQKTEQKSQRHKKGEQEL